MQTFCGDLELAALGDGDSILRLVAASLRHVLDLLDDLITLKDFAEDDVLAIQPAGVVLVRNMT